MSGIVAYIDGGARGNHGPAGYGVHVETDPGEPIEEFHGFIGSTTNNIAEYNGLLAALRYATERGHRIIRIKSDSELVVKQMLGQYKVKHPGLQPLYQEAQALARGLERVTYECIRREQNKDAARLANQAMDEGTAGR